jgi:glycosyltransferase involved in cell wall biosynthesis
MSSVTTVIPTRDRPDGLRRSVRSVLAQRDIELEVVVVDDGSTEPAVPVVAAFDDPRVRLVRHEVSLGESAARNRGIAEARGDRIAFLDDDDLWAPDKLIRQTEALRSTGRSWAYGGEVVVDDELRVLSGSPPPPPDAVAESLRRYNAVPGSASSVLVTRELLSRVGTFDTGLRRTADWDLWLRLVREGPPAAVLDPVVAISVHPGNVSRDMESLFSELDVIAARYGVDVDIARHRRWAAWTSLLEGRRAGAVHHYLAAVRAGDPTSLLRAVAALVPRRPGIRDPASTADDAWIDRARRWLEPFEGARR